MLVLVGATFDEQLAAGVEVSDLVKDRLEKVLGFLRLLEDEGVLEKGLGKWALDGVAVQALVYEIVEFDRVTVHLWISSFLQLGNSTSFNKTKYLKGLQFSIGHSSMCKFNGCDS